MPRLLVLGSSWFLGRAVVDAALSAGWEVTTFRRGRHESGDDPANVTTIRGDYADPAAVGRLAKAGPFDAVVDNLAYTPRETLAVARALEPATNRYVMVSTVSVYEGWPVEPLTEDSAVLECAADAGPNPGYDGDPGPSTYGFGKAGCERAITETFGPDRATILRPGVILGPHEYVGRLPWWLRRMERAGEVLAAGSPDRSIQPVDVRDVAAFAVRCAAGQAGIFNVAAPGDETMGDFLTACRRVTGSDATITWITDEPWLIDQGVRQWTEIPLWRTYAGAWAVDTSRARAAGLVTRPLVDTARDTWEWLTSGTMVEHERAGELGISPVKEVAILQAWRAREADRCGAQ
ncbi:MAG: NAD-dependent epimerase/dehydratase family protein [Kutzneria sp.]|nr:NAD-dependent epimerase/dehydratase family protein [Kutzneria sp.]MBV9846179.1 NAD-dependent epimerase/dehydratase family protein [Kutzneria sp.]